MKMEMGLQPSLTLISWAGKVIGMSPDGQSPEKLLGLPNGQTQVLGPGIEFSVSGFHEQPPPGLALLFENVTHGDRPTLQQLQTADFIAFERNGSSPALGGGWESCDWVFDDGTRSQSVRWFGQKDPPFRDMRVVANGSIPGRTYRDFFGIPADVPAPDGPVGDGEVISFLLFSLPTLEMKNPNLSVTVSFTAIPPAPVDASITPDIDAMGVLIHFAESDVTLRVQELLNMSTQLADAGRHDEALTAAQAATDVQRGSGTAPGQVLLPAGTAHDLTLIPATGYRFQPAARTVADFSFDVGVDGGVVVHPRFNGFAQSTAHTLTIKGHRVAVDGRDLANDLMPLSFVGGSGTLPRDRVNTLALVPASGYVLRTVGVPTADFPFTVDTDGKINLLDVPGGPIIMRPEDPPETLRSFYADLFMPARGSLRLFTDEKATRSLRTAIHDHQHGLLLGRVLRDEILAVIDELFDGATSEEEEDIALQHLLDSSRASDLAFLVNKLTWSGLDDELDQTDLNRIMDRLMVLMDRHDYLVGFLLRWFFLVDDNSLPNIDLVNVLTPFAASRSTEVRHSFADQCLIPTQRDAVLNGIAVMALRLRDPHLREFKLALDSAAGPELYRGVHLQRLSWDAFYTDRICSQLAVGEYRLLLSTLTDLVNPGNPQFPVQNIALFNMLRRWDRHFLALERAIAIVGTQRQQADVRRFMFTKKLFMDNFPPQPPAPGAPPAAFLAPIVAAIQAIQTTLTGVAGSFADLVNAVQAITDAIEDISVGQLLGTIDGDNAMAAVNTMAGEGLLALLPALYKSELLKRVMDGSVLDPVGDAREAAVLTVLRDTKTRSQAEFLQIAAGATWQLLDDSIQGSEFDELVQLFKFS
ncbi:hypothetical protein ACFY1J_42560 [Streptomyces sp. NPDC001406]|uniref:hypothetical protein n=1 Tax=Streptomyces sp. NPDC001406 TaxID=3364572 RepID=UPI0036D02C7B